MPCDYEILAESLLCARYYLYYFDRGAAHPWRSMDCITIDLETGLEIELTDIMVIDGRFEKRQA